jgi:hypothetical protein
MATLSTAAVNKNAEGLLHLAALLFRPSILLQPSKSKFNDPFIGRLV